jgi:hypothetical protein
MKKLLFIFAFVAIGMMANAQVYTMLQPGGQSIDTVTNTGVAYVSSVLVKPAPAVTTTFWVSVTKISGTVGGTISLQGSLDGTNWKALNQPNTQTAVTTITATDATANYHWVISGSPFQYYRVSWTGTGTMAASFGAQLFRSK